MTGYGEGAAHSSETELHIQVKTLNHRFFQLQIICAEDMPWEIEKEIEKTVRRRIHRGKVVITVQMIDSQTESARVEPDLQKAYAYHQSLEKLAQSLGLSGEVNLSHVLGMPGVLREKQRAWEKNGPLLLQALKQALSHVSRSRKTEGDKHKNEIVGHLQQIQSAAQYIEQAFPVCQQKYRDKIQEEFDKLGSCEELGLSANQVNPKLALMVTKGDVTEEIVRFKSHLAQFKQTIRERGAIGKKLGFLLQELQRETNTIGAKSLSSEISSRVVEMKDNIEKIREQAYNIE